MTISRNTQIQVFLSKHGWQDAQQTALQQDASFRRYWRLNKGAQTLLLMDAPPPEKKVSEFAAIAQFLRQQDLYAPEIFAFDDDMGLMLLEDFGEDTFTRILEKQPDSELTLYQAATDSLIKIHKIKILPSLSLSNYDDEVLLQEASLMLDWFYPAILKQQAKAGQRKHFEDAWMACFSALHNQDKQCKAQPNVLVLRDYHVDNLMRVHSKNTKTAKEGLEHCGLLDFQDALIGSPAYDLVSLLEDARRVVSPRVKSNCLKRYITAMTTINKMDASEQSRFIADMNILGAQRHAKVLGIFVRLAQRDHKTHYIKHLPHVLALFQAAIQREPLLSPIANWMRAELPFEQIQLDALF